MAELVVFDCKVAEWFPKVVKVPRKLGEQLVEFRKPFFEGLPLLQVEPHCGIPKTRSSSLLDKATNLWNQATIGLSAQDVKMATRGGSRSLVSIAFADNL